MTEPGHPTASPWVRLERRTVYENPWIEVLHDEVLRPDGSPGIYGVVHFRSRAVGVVPVADDGRILLVGQYRYTIDRYSWEIPEGGVPFDEDPLDGVKRELAEETGYRADAWRVLVPDLHTSNSSADEAGVLYVASGLTAGEASPEPTERIELRWVDLDEALAMIERGEITDAMSQVGLLRYALEVGADRRERGGPAGDQ
jgi:8-oxo-dGTP pyrophosphatase MutT (NUDIX family)